MRIACWISDIGSRVSGSTRSGGRNPGKNSEKDDGSDEEVESEEAEAEKKEEGTPGKAAAGKLRDGVKKAGGDDAETRFATALIKGPDGNVTGEIAAQRGEFVVHPESKFGAIAPEEESAQNKDAVTEASKKTESRSVTPIKHVSSPRAGRKESGVFVNGNETNDFKFLFARRRSNVHFISNLTVQKCATDRRSCGD